MALGKKQTLLGASISPEMNGYRAGGDAVDAAAMAFGDQLLLRIDPRDIIRTADNPTGTKVIHYTAPNRDPAYFSDTGFSVGVISGKYGGQEVFIFPGVGAPGNNFACGPGSLSGKTAFTVFGVAHFDVGMLATAGVKPLFCMYRDRAHVEFLFAYRYLAAVNYLTVWGDLTDGSGENYNLDTSAIIDAGVPFAFAVRLVPGGGGSLMELYLDTMAAPVFSVTGRPTPDAGSVQFFIGHLFDSSERWQGGAAPFYIYDGDTMGNADDIAKSTALMIAMKLKHGVA